MPDDSGRATAEAGGSMAFALRQRSPQLLTVPFTPDNPPARIEEFLQDGRTKPMGSPTQNARGARTVCNSRSWQLPSQSVAKSSIGGAPDYCHQGMLIRSSVP